LHRKINHLRIFSTAAAFQFPLERLPAAGVSEDRRRKKPATV